MLKKNEEEKSNKRASTPLVADNLQESLSSKALTLIVFGASGHLARTKTFPALFDLFVENVYPISLNIIGYARSKLSENEFHQSIVEHLKGDKETINKFVSCCKYFQGKSYDDEASYKKLQHYIQELESKYKSLSGSNRLCYLAIPPGEFINVSKNVSKYLQAENGWTRVMIEKPFGKDLETSNCLIREIAKYLKEAQIYRIDHYLAKEMVQNILVLRFSNTIWDTIWDRKSIKCVKISMKEDVGVEGRGGYYEEYGVIRDILQNHLIQVLCLIAMEAPVSLKAEDVRDEKVKVLKAIQPPVYDNCVVGQYGKSEDDLLEGYKDDESVKQISSNSKQITFCQAVLFINNNRWSGVPFICKAGKGLDSKNAEIRIQFKNDGCVLYPKRVSNELVIRLQPKEAIWLKVNTKKPGFARFDTSLQHELDLTYQNRFGQLKLPEAYTRLILDTLQGDPSLFVREDELTEAWRIFTPLLHKLEKEKFNPPIYARGSRGPPEADEMAERFGFSKNSDDYSWPKRQISPVKL